MTATPFIFTLRCLHRSRPVVYLYSSESEFLCNNMKNFTILKYREFGFVYIGNSGSIIRGQQSFTELNSFRIQGFLTAIRQSFPSKNIILLLHCPHSRILEQLYKKTSISLCISCNPSICMAGNTFQPYRSEYATKIQKSALRSAALTDSLAECLALLLQANILPPYFSSLLISYLNA